jgi:hypothetical protein
VQGCGPNLARLAIHIQILVSEKSFHHFVISLICCDMDSCDRRPVTTTIVVGNNSIHIHIWFALQNAPNYVGKIPESSPM